MQIEMLYDLHGNSGKSNSMSSNQKLNRSPSSPPLVSDSTNSLREGAAITDLTVSGKSATTSTTMPAHVVGAEMRGLSGSLNSNNKVASIVASGEILMERPGKPNPGRSNLGMDGSESEPLWNGSERDELVRF